MELEFKVETDHLSRDDPAIEAAVDGYTSTFLPFGHRNGAYERLKEKQDDLLEKYGTEEIPELSPTVLKATGQRLVVV